nr:GNAT family N-acetyltransferase [Streptomyces javensis]
MHRELSPEATRLRFFAVNPYYAREAADRVCAPGHRGYRALLALADGRVVGVAEYTVLPAPPGEPVSADIGLAVAEGRRGQGIGTLLLEHLVHSAREAGVSGFTAEALAENHEVLKVFADLGLAPPPSSSPTTPRGSPRSPTAMCTASSPLRAAPRCSSATGAARPWTWRDWSSCC